MARRKRKKGDQSCRYCKSWIAPEDTVWGNICPSCRDQRAREKRAKTGERLLAVAKTSTVEIDGKTFVVKTLPPKRGYRPR